MFYYSTHMQADIFKMAMELFRDGLLVFQPPSSRTDGNSGAVAVADSRCRPSWRR